MYVYPARCLAILTIPASLGDTITSNAITSRLTNAKSDLEKHDYEITATSTETDEFPAPTEEEKASLRKVPATLPLVSFSLCIVEFAERASYYGAKNIFSNFIEFPLPKGISAVFFSTNRDRDNRRQVEMEPVLPRGAHRRRPVRWEWVCRLAQG